MYKIIQRRNRIYILEDDKLVEKYDTLRDINSIEGNIYVGKVENVLNGMKIAFVDIGKDKNGVLPFSDFARKYEDDEIPTVLKAR